MTPGKKLASLAALLLAVVGSQLLVWWLRPAPVAAIVSGPPRSDYQLNHFTLRAFDSTGQLAFTVTAPQLARRAGDAALYLNTPRFEFPGNDGAVWQGRSDYGWISNDNNLVKLIGQVELQRPAGAGMAATDVHTADASVWTRTRLLQTAAASVIQQPGSILRGIGMHADFNTHTLELLADVHGTFQPNPPASH